MTPNSTASRVAILAGVAAIVLPSQPRTADGDEPPPITREFRGAWVATVANIDWPSKPGLPPAQQREEMVTLLDAAKRLNLNAVVLQVRPACDAIYPSDLEPWSGYVTGEMGTPPPDGYDPLAFAVEEAHKRGLQLHAWFNPYRALHATWKGGVSPNHVSRKLLASVLTYGKQMWLDPGSTEAEEHTLSVMVDVVRRYDVDAVHFDDYFYPYPVSESADPDANGLDGGVATRREVPFPDDATWEAYLATAGPAPLSRGDWRRANVNRLVRRVGEAVKAEKPAVMFGISPFGIWRPGHPASVSGFDAYEKLYADSRLWMQEGWIDYSAPQLYWAIAARGQSYPDLLGWWSAQNERRRMLWPGNYTSRVSSNPNGKTKWAAGEVVEQIQLTRDAPGASGNIHFSIKSLVKNYGGVADALASGPYAEPALPPVCPWLDLPAPPTEPPQLALEEQQLQIHADAQPWQWAVQLETEGGWRTKLLPGAERQANLAELFDGGGTRAAVRSIDRYGQEGPPRVIALASGRKNQ